LQVYIKNFADRDGKVWHGGGGRNPPPDVPHLVVTTPEIENLRPKSPQKNQQGQMGSSSSTNRRPVPNTTQNVVTVVGSETMMPAQWASTPVGGFGMREGGGGPGSNNLDSYGFNAPFRSSNGGHMDFNYSLWIYVLVVPTASTIHFCTRLSVLTSTKFSRRMNNFVVTLFKLVIYPGILF
jgi:mRNA m6A methyltransferase non-catalytic subunit